MGGGGERWGESQVKNKIVSQAGKQHTKTHSEDAYTGYLTATLRWLCIRTQLFRKLFAGADLKSKGEQSRTAAQGQRNPDVKCIKVVTHSKCIRPQMPKKPFSGSRNRSKARSYRHISGCWEVLLTVFSYSEVVANATLAHTVLERGAWLQYRMTSKTGLGIRVCSFPGFCSVTGRECHFGAEIIWGECFYYHLFNNSVLARTIWQ